MRKRLLCALFGFLVGYLLPSATVVARPQVKPPDRHVQSAQKFFSDLGVGSWNAGSPSFNKVDWVDKRCRLWDKDGDIDVDQTCIVVKNVSGSVSVVPNRFNDGWAAEISSEMAKSPAARDKWIRRFLEVRGW